MEVVEQSGAELIVLARYMQVLSDAVCKKMAGCIIDIHHSFPPLFLPTTAQHPAWRADARRALCTPLIT